LLRPHRREPRVLVRGQLPPPLDPSDRRAARARVPARRADRHRAAARLERHPVDRDRVRRRRVLPLPRAAKGGAMIALTGATKRYNGSTVLDDVTTSFGEEGITSLIGPNGAGKSTLFGLVGRLIAPDGGSVTVDGLDVQTTSSKQLALTIAVLRQDNQLAARLTVQDLVEFGRFPHSRGRLTTEDRDRVDEAISYLALTELRGRFLDELSGGQRQRAFIAMVLAQDTKYVLLDEPLNNLDLKHLTEIM